MSKICTNISLDSELKTQAQELMSDLGLDLSSAITLFLKQAVREQRIPFEIRRNIPNRETIEALNEFSQMKSDKFAYKRYNSFNDIIKEACEENVEYRPVK
jgi:DNA-damage-inducible protein J